MDLVIKLILCGLRLDYQRINISPYYKMEIYQDCRTISMNSQDATQFNNGSNLSDLVFDFKNVLVDAEDILYTTIGIVDAQIPVSWYLIDSDTDTIKFTWNSVNYSVTLEHGNYNATTFIAEITKQFQLIPGLVVIILLNKVNGKLSFDFKGSSVPYFTFLCNGSKGLFRIIGFDINTNYSGVDIIPPFPLNLLGIQRLKICSLNLATNDNYDSSKSGTSVLQIIPIDVPAYGLITFTNKLNTFGKLKTKNISSIDIQLLDEFGRYIQMNGIHYCLTIQLTIFRQNLNTTRTSYINPINQPPINIDESPIQNLEPEPESDEIPTSIVFENNDTNFDNPDDDLGLLLYNSTFNKG